MTQPTMPRMPFPGDMWGTLGHHIEDGYWTETVRLLKPICNPRDIDLMWDWTQPSESVLLAAALKVKPIYL